MPSSFSVIHLTTVGLVRLLVLSLNTIRPLLDNTEKSVKEAAPSRIPSSLSHEGAFFTQIPCRMGSSYPLRDFRFHRRPPSPAVGMGLQQSFGRVRDYNEALIGPRLGSRLASRSFVDYPTSTEWLLHRRPTQFSHRRASPPPQRIQAFVPQRTGCEMMEELSR